MYTPLPDGTMLFKGTYRIVGRLGAGGFGITYRAVQLNLNREVAIKEWFPSDCNRVGNCLRADGRVWTTERLEQFKTKASAEGQILASLENSHIVRIYDLFAENDTVYFVMEFIQGTTLGDYRKHMGGKLSVDEAIAIIRNVCTALQDVHAKRLLHRDITERNIMRRSNGDIVLIDFGAAREFVSGQEMSHTGFRSDGYAPPEQYEHRGEWGPSLDIYSVSVTLYVLLTGVVPDQESRYRRYLDKVQPIRTVRPEVSEALGEFVVKRGMALEASARPQSVADFLSELKRVCQPPSPKVSPPTPPREKLQDVRPVAVPVPLTRRAVIGTLGAGMLGLAGWEIWQSNQTSGHPLPRNPVNSGATNVGGSGTNGGNISARQTNTKRPNAPQMKDNAELVYIWGGPFLMGDDDQKDNPRHTVTLSGYWMYKNPVTVAQFRAYDQANGQKYDWTKHRPDWGWRDDNPMVRVSWDEAVGYAHWVGGELPTEAQFERAARGTDGLKYPWGNTWQPEKVWFNKSSTEGTTSVGHYGLSVTGCTDMTSNVWEWCKDWYDVGYWKTDHGKNPENTGTGRQKYRVVRGGSWGDDGVPVNFRAAYRTFLNPTDRLVNLGFRCVVRADSF